MVPLGNDHSIWGPVLGKQSSHYQEYCTLNKTGDLAQKLNMHLACTAALLQQALDAYNATEQCVILGLMISLCAEQTLSASNISAAHSA